MPEIPENHRYSSYNLPYDILRTIILNSFIYSDAIEMVYSLFYTKDKYKDRNDFEKNFISELFTEAFWEQLLRRDFPTAQVDITLTEEHKTWKDIYLFLRSESYKALLPEKLSECNNSAKEQASDIRKLFEYINLSDIQNIELLLTEKLPPRYLEIDDLAIKKAGIVKNALNPIQFAILIKNQSILDLFYQHACKYDPKNRLEFAASCNQPEAFKEANLGSWDCLWHLLSAINYEHSEVVAALTRKNSHNIKMWDYIQRARASGSAAKKGNLEILSILIDYNLYFNLSTAVDSGHLHVIEYLCTHPKLTYTSEEFAAAFIEALKNDHLNIATYLLELHPEILTEENKAIAFFNAIDRENVSVLEFLLSKDININEVKSKAKSSISALGRAIKTRNLKIITLLVNNGAKILDDDPSGTPLQYAVDVGNLEVLKYLFDQIKNDPSMADKEYLLHFAIKKNYKDIIDYLIDMKANVDQPDQDGNSPLHIAAKNNNLEIAQVLKGNNALLNLPNADNETPLDIALQNRNTELAGYLIQQGVDPAPSFKKAKTCLHYYVNDWLNRSSNDKMVEFLMLHGANVNLVIDNKTALFFSRSASMTAYLIDNGADVNFRDNLGNTPLHHLMMHGIHKGSILKTLVEKGADTTLLNKEQKTPLNLAKEKSYLLAEAKYLQQIADNSSLKKQPLQVIYLLFQDYSQAQAGSELLATFSRFFKGRWGNNHGQAVAQLLCHNYSKFNSVDNLQAFILDLEKIDFFMQYRQRNGDLDNILNLVEEIYPDLTIPGSRRNYPFR